LGALVGLFGLATVTGWSLAANRRQVADVQAFERQREADREKRRLVAVIASLQAEISNNLSFMKANLAGRDKIIAMNPRGFSFPPVGLRNEIYLSVLGEIGGLGHKIAAGVGIAANHRVIIPVDYYPGDPSAPESITRIEKLTNSLTRSLEIGISNYKNALELLKNFDVDFSV